MTIMMMMATTISTKMMCSLKSSNYRWEPLYNTRTYMWRPLLTAFLFVIMPPLFQRVTPCPQCLQERLGSSL